MDCSPIKQSRLLGGSSVGCTGWWAVQLTFFPCPLSAAKHRAVTGQALQSPGGAASKTGGRQGAVRQTAHAQRTSWRCGRADARASGPSTAVLPTGNWFWQLLQDIVLGFRSMMQRALCFLFSWGHSGALRCTFQATRGANDRCCSSISADALFIPHLEIPLTPCQAAWV